VHSAALQLMPILAAEKSKVPFFIAGGLLVAWALIVSAGLGLRRPDFPGGLSGQRAVIAISAVLVLGAVSTAVITSGSAAKAGTTSAAAAPSALKLAANPGGQLSFDTKQLSAKAGTVTIALTNAAPLEHNVTIAQGSTVLGATPTFTGGSKSVTLTLKPGTYTFYCSVPGHRQAGMEGTLSVS
jgi:uncharacterized cupredoxin-like copper-binding protein